MRGQNRTTNQNTTYDDNTLIKESSYNASISFRRNKLFYRRYCEEAIIGIKNFQRRLFNFLRYL